MRESESTLRTELGDKLKFNVILKDYVSIGVGGVADYFYEADSIEDLVHAVSLSYKLRIPYLVMGGGYNIIPSDSGFPGLVILNRSSGILFANDSSQVIVDSGVNISTLINLAAGRGLGGMEFMYGIPGTIGGSIYGNAGAFGHEIGGFVKSLTLLIPKDGQMAIMKHVPGWMKFSYRGSYLKDAYRDAEFKPIILTARIQLVQRRRDEIIKIIQTRLSEKKKKQPLNEKSAGSFFRNIGARPEQSAGYLLDQAGAKRLRVGGASFSKKHANFLINSKHATANDVRTLAKQAQSLVKEKFNYDLLEEIEYIGQWSD